MAYTKGYGNGRNQKQNNTSVIRNMNKPLSQELQNLEDLYLPGGYADQIAQEMSRITNAQMRKVLDGAKLSLAVADTDLNAAKKQMFVLVTMSAYNAGRMNALKPLYDFMKKTVSLNTIKTKEDIETFDELFTSVVAYHKVLANTK